jgi:hypothetical protein
LSFSSQRIVLFVVPILLVLILVDAVRPKLVLWVLFFLTFFFFVLALGCL